jgi:hypothetical protein
MNPGLMPAASVRLVPVNNCKHYYWGYHTYAHYFTTGRVSEVWS